jgi:adenylate cyclase
LSTERKLAAIMLADIAGYSTLMERDESRTFARLRVLREQLINPKVAEFGGRIIKTTGDGFLAEFPSATAALGCGITMQRINHAQEANKDAAERFHLRIGINLGDIIIDGDDVSGDGVNVAARLEPLAPLDGICVSGAVRDQVREDLGVVLEDLGEQQVKNIERPIRAYRINLVSAPLVKPVRRRLKSRKRVIGAVATLLLLLGVGADFLLFGHLSKPAAPRLSVVVLPFANTSGDPGQDYVADAITDDITVELSKIKGSFVIGRGTAFSYKGKAVDLKAVAKELDIRYVLQGTAARNDDKFHVTIQVADGLSGANLWSASFDSDRERFSDLKQDVVSRMAVALNFQLVSADAKKSAAKSNPDAVDLTMQGWAKFNEGISQENLLAAERLFSAALKIQPDDEPALAGRARVDLELAGTYPSPDSPRQMTEAEQNALQALKLDPNDPVAHEALANVRLHQGSREEGIAENQRAIELNPNYAEAIAFQGAFWAIGGKLESALTAIESALKLSPRDPNLADFLFYKCMTLMFSDKVADAIPVCEKSVNVRSVFYGWEPLVALYTAIGDQKGVDRARQTLLKLKPDYSVTHEERNYKSAYSPAMHERLDIYFANLRKAGLPE